jgi:hypothetical protein
MRTKRNAFILVAVVLAALFVASIGATAAIWSGEGGENGYAPQTSVSDWNTWAKYFEYEQLPSGGIALTKYKGTNLQDVLIPSAIDGYTVKEIRNSVFGDTSLKSVPVSISVSPYVVKIDAAAFSNLPNLKKVIFGSTNNEETDGTIAVCAVADFAFAGCGSLNEVSVQGWKKVNFSASAFLGCGALASLPQSTG